MNRKNFGEADRILTVFTRDWGKIICLAKGVRRPRSKKAGHLELGTWCKIFVARGKNLDLLCEVETKRAFGIVDFSIKKTNTIYHLLELIDKLTPEHQKNLQVFILLVQFLKKCQTQDDFDFLSSVFKVKLLSLLGFFSTSTLKPSTTKDVLESFEKDDLEIIQDKTSLSRESYLKLLTYLDSMIENLTQQKLKTVRFL